MGENVQKVGDVTIVKFSNRLDVYKSVQAENDILEMINGGVKYLLFDMSQVVYISSSGLRIFITTMRKLRDVNGVLKVSGMKNNIKHIFQTVELLDLIDLYDSTQDALKSFDEVIS